MLNLHQLADELNRDRLTRTERHSLGHEVRSQRHNLAARQALDAVRQAINQIDAIIEGAVNWGPPNRSPRGARRPSARRQGSDARQN